MHAFNLQTGLALDTTGHPYVNVDVPDMTVLPYLRWLQKILTPLASQQYVAHQQRRDRGRHHITVVSPLEYPQLALARIEAVLAYPVHVHLLGVGHVREANNEVYFVVCQCPEVQRMRAYLGLPPADLHITLGFEVSDIFDQPKDASTLLAPFSALEYGAAQG